MKYWYQKPDPRLSQYIRTVLVIEGFSRPLEQNYPLVTNGMPGLVCKTVKTGADVENISQLALYGKSTPSECYSIDETTTVIVYFFLPFAMATLFNTSASRLLKAPIPLAEWSPHKMNALKAQLIYAGATERKIEVLNNLLVQQWRHNLRECELVRTATDEIMNDSGPEILPRLLMRLNINERTFQRTFKKFVGVTPNQYRRICQFQLSFAQLRAKKFEKLTDIAFDNRFADQSHFNRSFKEFTETTPNDYLRDGLKNKK